MVTMTGSLLQKRGFGGLCALAVLAGLALSACSSGDEGGDGSTAAPSSGLSGTGGANNGQGGASNGSGGAVSGSAGQAAGTAGAAGKATGGAAGGGGAQAGHAGSGGEKAGAAGMAGMVAGAGASGKGGAGGLGGKITCDTTNDCVGFIPETKPAGCAKTECDATQKFCRFVAKDLDGDGDASNACASLDAHITIELGGDCNESDERINSKAWDGPAGLHDGVPQPNRCDDGADNDCNGKDDDGALDNGETCKCVPGDVRKCSADSAGKPISFPGGVPQGECRHGNQTCDDTGKWGACTDAVGPTAEICDKKDNDCDGKLDEQDDVLNPPTWVCDLDSDGHAATDGKTLIQCAVPTENCGTKGTWTTSKLPVDDCNDYEETAYLGALEICDGLDNNCNELVDENLPSQGECHAGLGACRRAGDLSCVGGSYMCDAVAAPVQGEEAQYGSENPYIDPTSGLKTYDWNCDGQEDIIPWYVSGYTIPGHVGFPNTWENGKCEDLSSFYCTWGYAEYTDGSNPKGTMYQHWLQEQTPLVCGGVVKFLICWDSPVGCVTEGTGSEIVRCH